MEFAGTRLNELKGVEKLSQLVEKVKSLEKSLVKLS